MTAGSCVQNKYTAVSSFVREKDRFLEIAEGAFPHRVDLNIEFLVFLEQIDYDGKYIKQNKKDVCVPSKRN